MFDDLLFRLRSLFRRGAVESEADTELRFHFDQQVEKYLKSGLPRGEAAGVAPVSSLAGTNSSRKRFATRVA